MATVRIIASQNGVSRTLSFEPVKADGSQVTYVELCKMPAVIDLFNNASSDQQNIEPAEILSNLVQVGDDDTPTTPVLRNSFVNSPVVANLDIVFDLIGNEDEDEDDEEEAATAQTSRRPSVTVYPSGGVSDEVTIQIVPNQTTVYDAIHNDAVRGSSGWSDDMISICNVDVNGTLIAQNDLRGRTLNNGDRIVLYPKKAHTNGNC